MEVVVAAGGGVDVEVDAAGRGGVRGVMVVDGFRFGFATVRWVGRVWTSGFWPPRVAACLTGVTAGVAGSLCGFRARGRHVHEIQDGRQEDEAGDHNRDDAAHAAEATRRRGGHGRAVELEVVVEQVPQARRHVGCRDVVAVAARARALELVEALAQAGELARARPLPPAVQPRRRIGLSERGLVDRGQDALAVADRDRPSAGRMQQGPFQERGRAGADGHIGEGGRVGRESGGRDPLGQAAEGESEPGGVGRGRAAQHPPPLDR